MFKHPPLSNVPHYVKFLDRLLREKSSGAASSSAAPAPPAPAPPAPAPAPPAASASSSAAKALPAPAPPAPPPPVEEIRARLRNLSDHPTLENYNKVYELLPRYHGLKEKFESAFRKGVQQNTLRQYARPLEDLVWLRFATLLFKGRAPANIGVVPRDLDSHPYDFRFREGLKHGDNPTERLREERWYEAHAYLGEAKVQKGHNNVERILSLLGAWETDVWSWLQRRSPTFSNAALMVVAESVLTGKQPLTQVPEYVKVLERLIRKARGSR
jgi:hypothetical protein